MVGGAGDDTYYVDNAGDIVVENAGAGSDTVRSWISYTLGNNVERLVLLGNSSIDGIGNSLNNTIVGNGAANMLTGGTGRDVLTGGDGTDHFLFNAALNSSSNIDRITDYNVLDDTMILDNAIFSTIETAGLLAVDAFHNGAAAQDAADRIVYNSATGALYYDSDGSAAGGRVQFAALAVGLQLTNLDFLIV